MSAGPKGIEIAWGGGRWLGGQKNAVRPHVKAAVELAVDGLDFFDVDFRIPKQVRIFRTPRNYPYHGVSLGPWDIELYVDCRDVKHRKIGRLAPELATTAFHEMLHSVRSETEPDGTLLSAVSTEGIAYFGEERFSRLALTPSEFDATEVKLHDNTLRNTAALYDALLADADAETHMGQYEGVFLHEAWLDYDQGEFYSHGVGLGVIAARHHFLEGMSIGEMTRVPSRQFLGVLTEL
jgi:hypothetical protein